MAESVRYAVCCRACGHIEDKAWTPATNEEHSKPTEKPLTPQGQVPIYCQQCGQRQWDKPASAAQLEAFELKARREQRAVELTRGQNFDGFFNIPDEIKASPEVKRALGNLLAPLEGETLKTAQQNVIKISRSGAQGDALMWIEYYDRAVAKAIASTATSTATRKSA